MKKLLVLLGFVAFTGCTSVSLDDSFKESFDSSKRFGVIGFTSQHFGDSSNSMRAMGGELFNAIADSNLKEGGGEDYELKLDQKVFGKIDEALAASSLVNYVKVSDLTSTSGSELDVTNPAVVANFASQNNLDYVMSAHVFYMIWNGFSKPIALDIDWKFFNSDGSSAGKVKTINTTEERYGAFPSTREARFEEPYTQLSTEAVNKFLGLLVAE